MAFTTNPDYGALESKSIGFESNELKSNMFSINIVNRFTNCFLKTSSRDEEGKKQRKLVKRPNFNLSSIPTPNPTEPLRAAWRDARTGRTWFCVEQVIYVTFPFSNTIDQSINVNATVPLFDINLQNRVYFLPFSLGTITYVFIYADRANSGVRLNIDGTGILSFNLGFLCTGKPQLFNNTIYIPSNTGASTSRIYNSLPGDPSIWSASTRFIDTEMVADSITDLEVSKEHLIAFGTKSIEVFYDGAVKLGSPLIRRSELMTTMGTGFPSQNNTCQVLNDIYYVGIPQFTGPTRGIYRLSNLQHTKVSPGWLDYLLQRFDVRIFPITIYSKECLMVEIYTDFGLSILNAVSPFQRFIYEPYEEQWFEITFGAENTILNQAKTVAYSEGIAFTGARVSNTFVTFTVSDVSFIGTAQVITESFDGGSSINKYLRYLDIIGEIGDNTITLDYSKRNDSAFIGPQSINVNVNDSTKNYRVSNIGRFNQVTFRLSFTGGQIAIDRLDLYYNSGFR